MKFRIISCACLALLVLSAVALQPCLRAQTKTSGSGTVAGSGCLTAGVEGGCLGLTDFKTKKVYNLFFMTEKKPDVETAIYFEGTIHEGPTICMQGAAVDVTNWTLLKMKCPSTKPKPTR